MTFQSRYSQLNERQKEAVDTIYGPVMVLAGPGSGKTELLSLRVANILSQVDVYPKQILCLTFTESGEKNMRNRLFGLIGKDAYQVSIHTFHGFAASIHARNKELFFDGKEMRIADDVEKKSLLHEVLESLSLDNPLRTKGPDGKYVYEFDILHSITRLKNAGLSPEDYKKVLEMNDTRYKDIEQSLSCIGKTVSKKIIAELEDAIAYVQGNNRTTEDISFFSYDHAVYLSLSHALESAKELGKTSPITEWKNTWFKKDPKTGVMNLVDATASAKQYALVEVYASYVKKMRDASLIDFDDILLGLLDICKENPGLVADMQELYQFILVDEYQDTNNAQLKIVQYLTRDVENPNVLVVGDDDQAIYKFQGADVNNIFTFIQLFENPKIIHLEKNYRSKKNIVEFSKAIIKNSEERASTLLLGGEKAVSAHQSEEGNIVLSIHNHPSDEYQFIARDIKKYVKSGGNPLDVVVIARNHKTLQEIVPYFLKEQVDIRYDQQRNILVDAHIVELLTLIELILEMQKEGPFFSQHLLPTVMQFPWINMPKEVVWKISIDAYKNRDGKIATWITTMLDAGGDLELFAKDLISLAARAKIEPFSDWIYHIIGKGSEEFPYISGRFQEHYYKDIEKNNANALILLSSLELFLSTIRNIDKHAGPCSVERAFSVFCSYQKTGTAITDTTPYISGLDAVQLCTAHGTKGLEFSRVYIVDTTRNGWSKPGRSKKLSFPKNVPIDIISETGDDALRLFFVAVTRAMNDIVFTKSKQDESGKRKEDLEFLEEDIINNFISVIEETNTESRSLETKVYSPIVTLDSAPFLKDIAENMVLAPTHILNFLKIKDGGPELFFRNNLVRFPDKKNDHSVFGTAMHSVAEKLVPKVAQYSMEQLLEFVRDHLTELLQKEWHDKEKISLRVDSGVRIWEKYLEQRKEYLIGEVLTEINMKGEGIHIKQVPITGRIDKIHVDGKNLTVVDYKTSRPIESWEERDKDKRVKLEEYKLQLYMYKLLIEHSRQFLGYTVVAGKIEFLSEHGNVSELALNMENCGEELERVSQLIAAIKRKIVSLDFPDVQGYSPDIHGYTQLIDDLITGTI